MCGLAGMVDSKLSREQGDALLTRMLNSIRHRGPDNSSRWIDMPVMLGHNRLSIIALSEDANQPMEFEDLVIVYNGEVYNYLELRAELIKEGYAFRTESDTEVVLLAYKRWGRQCVQRFVGMWAFAIWDKSRRELFCSRDRFGIKPFYYIHRGDRFYFGSEYKPLKLSPLFSSRLNEQQIGRGLLMEVPCYREESFFECIKVLPERSNLLFKNGQVSVTEYWDINPSIRFRGSFEDKKGQFLQLFRDSIKLHLRSDVEVGGCLSGGLDSSAIASVVGRDHAVVPFKTFTIYYDSKHRMDERQWVTEVLNTYPSLKAFYCSPSDEQLAASFDCVLRTHDIPIIRSSTISYYFIMQLAGQHQMKVMLDGQGSDEYLAGYEPSFSRVIAGQLRRLRLLGAWRALHWPACRRRGRRSTAETGLRAALWRGDTLARRRLRSRYTAMGLDSVPEFALRRFNGSPLKEYLYQSLFITSLPTMLHYQDRVAMLFSIENRVPFLDHRLIEFAHSLDDEDLVSLGRTKYILRASLEQFLPRAIASRTDKVKFSGADVTPWLQGPLQHLVAKPLKFDGLSILNSQQVSTLVDRFKQGDRAQSRRVWRLAVLHRWIETQ
jgi:asparagine synthase (glutamine-hydrolysing)